MDLSPVSVSQVMMEMELPVVNVSSKIIMHDFYFNHAWTT